MAWFPALTRRGGLIGVAHVGSGIVVVVLHVDHGILRQDHGLAIIEHGLPIGIPTGNAHQPFSRAIRQRGPGLQQLAQIMRVRIDRQNFRIQRQTEVVRNRKIARARWNIERCIVLKLHQQRKLRFGPVGEVEPDGRPHLFRFPRRLQVHIQHQLVARIEPPREPVPLHMRRAARFPEQEMAIGIERAAHNHQVHSAEALSRRGFLQARRSRAVHQQIGMVDQPARAGPDLDRPHPSTRRQMRREGEVPVDVRPRRRQGEGATRLQHEVRLSELPPFGKVRNRRSIGGRTFGRASAHPIRDCANLRSGQPPLALEIAIAMLRKPGRHIAVVSHGRNQSRTLLYIVIGEQGKRPRLPRMMARRAFPIDDRSDVVNESRSRSREQRRRQNRENGETSRFAPYSVADSCAFATASWRT